MQEYVIELSKYFIAFFMVLYTASCFYTFRYPVGEPLHILPIVTVFPPISI